MNNCVAVAVCQAAERSARVGHALAPHARADTRSRTLAHKHARMPRRALARASTERAPSVVFVYLVVVRVFV